MRRRIRPYLFVPTCLYLPVCYLVCFPRHQKSSVLTVLPLTASYVVLDLCLGAESFLSCDRQNMCRAARSLEWYEYNVSDQRGRLHGLRSLIAGRVIMLRRKAGPSSPLQRAIKFVLAVVSPGIFFGCARRQIQQFTAVLLYRGGIEL